MTPIVTQTNTGVLFFASTEPTDAYHHPRTHLFEHLMHHIMNCIRRARYRTCLMDLENVSVLRVCFPSPHTARSVHMRSTDTRTPRFPRHTLIPRGRWRSLRRWAATGGRRPSGVHVFSPEIAHTTYRRPSVATLCTFKQTVSTYRGRACLATPHGLSREQAVIYVCVCVCVRVCHPPAQRMLAFSQHITRIEYQ